MIEKKGDLKTQEIPYCERKCLNQGLTVTVNQCIFVGLSCAVSCEGCSKNHAPSKKPHDRPTDLFFRLNTLCTDLSGSNL